MPIFSTCVTIVQRCLKSHSVIIASVAYYMCNKTLFLHAWALMYISPETLATQQCYGSFCLEKTPVARNYNYISLFRLRSMGSSVGMATRLQVH